MDDLLLRGRMNLPITTGAAAPAAQRTGQDTRTKDTGASFRQMLEQMAGGQQLAFSKHAAGRIETREIPLSQAGLDHTPVNVAMARGRGFGAAPSD